MQYLTFLQSALHKLMYFYMQPIQVNVLANLTKMTDKYDTL